MCSLHDVFWLEEQGIPVAYVDTPGRYHKVTRDDGVFVIEYMNLKYIVPQIAAAPPGPQQALMLKQFERQGIYRALRQAGARPGDRVRLLDFEFQLEELPPTPKGWLLGSNGILGYTYIETAPIGRLEADEVKTLATDLLPQVIDKLVQE